jgi:hypothetical protein
LTPHGEAYWQKMPSGEQELPRRGASTGQPAEGDAQLEHSHSLTIAPSAEHGAHSQRPWAKSHVAELSVHDVPAGQLAGHAGGDAQPGSRGSTNQVPCGQVTSVEQRKCSSPPY